MVKPKSNVPGSTARGNLSSDALLRPLLRVGTPAADRADYDVAVYRDQLDELKRDEQRGTLSATEIAAARLEIERRLLKYDAELAERRHGIAPHVVAHDLDAAGIGH